MWTPPIFSPEIINLIFLSVSPTDPLTLARCCLLSKRYLNMARESLYRTLIFVTYDDRIDVGREITIIPPTTTRLVAAFTLNPDLMTLPKGINMECVRSPKKGALGVRTSNGDLLATAFELVEHLEHLDLDSTDEPEIRDAVMQFEPEYFEHVKTFEILYLTPYTYEFSSSLKRLESLSFLEIEDDFALPEDLELPPLKQISISSSNRAPLFDVSKFLSSSVSSLVDLSISIRHLREVTLSDYRNLRRLELKSDDRVFWTSIFEGLNRFSNLFKDCRQLSTLAFVLDSNIGDQAERFIFQGLAKELPESIRRIELGYAADARIDRVFNDGAGPVREMATRKTAFMDSDGVKRAREICQEKGVELIWLSYNWT
ncbi:uncharacterized protein JCM6883_005867 [Sporobolomyces salmoneus]|uniref:uncharacterized protein n=1 Tax=Sporobolomyces salmoneus TaxID=183962 RepID=UPI00316E60E9